MPHSRVIARYSGNEPGPLLVVIGAIHGNEPAGVIAIRKVMQLLKELPDTTAFKGRFVGFIGHHAAYLQQRRFFYEDLNRLWELSRIEKVQSLPPDERTPDEHELIALFNHIYQEIVDYQPNTLILLDLHTTSAEDGLFCIPTDEGPSLQLAKSLHVPVVLNLFGNLQGTLLRFKTEGGFNQASNGLQTTLGVAFEAGQHLDEQAADRCVAAIFNCLRAIGCLPPDTPDAGYNTKLETDSANLPKVVRLRSVHHIKPDDAFRMRPGYRNFQSIDIGEHLADDRHGPIYADTDGHILMPLYQPLGKEGFFVVSREAEVSLVS